MSIFKTEIRKLSRSCKPVQLQSYQSLGISGLSHLVFIQDSTNFLHINLIYEHDELLFSRTNRRYQYSQCFRTHSHWNDKTIYHAKIILYFPAGGSCKTEFIKKIQTWNTREKHKIESLVFFGTLAFTFYGVHTDFLVIFLQSS